MGVVSPLEYLQALEQYLCRCMLMVMVSETV